MNERIRNERGPVRQAPNFSARERPYAGAYHIDKSPAGVALQRMAEMVAGSAQRRAASTSATASTAQLAAAEEEELLQGKFATTQRAGAEEEELLQGKFATAQRASAEEEELLQGKFATAQRAGVEEEELLQGKFATAQRAGPEEDELQMKAIGAPVAQREDASPRRNDTGLPDQLKAGVEALSGMSLDHVKVHYNSAQPAQLNALAYAQGSDIHVAPGQEQHLPHEAWHIVQQAQGRVKPTMQLKDGVPVNDDAGLEREADVMGAKAASAVSMSDEAENAQRQVESAGTERQLRHTGGQGGKEALNLRSVTRSIMLRAPDAPVQRAVEIAGGASKGMYTSENLKELLDAVASVINRKVPQTPVKRGPLQMIHAEQIYSFDTLQELARHMTADYEGFVVPRDWPPPELEYGAAHGDYHFTGKVTKKKAQWNIAKGEAQELMESEIMKHLGRLRAESKKLGWEGWYIGGDAGKDIGTTVDGKVSTFCLQVQVSLSDNLISYHGYPDQRLKKTGAGKSKSTISDDETD